MPRPGQHGATSGWARRPHRLLTVDAGLAFSPHKPPPLTDCGSGAQQLGHWALAALRCSRRPRPAWSFDRFLDWHRCLSVDRHPGFEPGAMRADLDDEWYLPRPTSGMCDRNGQAGRPHTGAAGQHPNRGLLAFVFLSRFFNGSFAISSVFTTCHPQVARVHRCSDTHAHFGRAQGGASRRPTAQALTKWGGNRSMTGPAHSGQRGKLCPRHDRVAPRCLHDIEL
jgi:hypothetical protein